MIAQRKVVFTDNSEEQTDMDSSTQKQIVRDAYKQGFREAIKQKEIAQSEHTSLEGIVEGKKEQVKDTAKHEEFSKQKMEALAEKSDVILFQARTVFPFDFFPSSIVIDTSKVSIIERDFFATERITSILLKDVTDVVVESSLFLANLQLTYSHNPMKPIFCGIQKLWRTDALCAKEILEGVLVVHREGIDLSKISPETMKTFVQKLGTSRLKDSDSKGL